MRSTALLFILIIAAATPGWSAVRTITVTMGPWTQVVGAANLQAGTGTDFVPTYENTSAGSIAVDTPGNSGYQVWAQRTAVAGAGSAVVFNIKRLNGGTVYDYDLNADTDSLVYRPIPVSTRLAFFNGRGDNNGIQFRVQMANISVTLPIGSYSTTITLTIS